MIVSLYDKVILKNGRIAVIVEIYDQGIAYEADIEAEGDYVTDTIKHQEIKEIIRWSYAS